MGACKRFGSTSAHAWKRDCKFVVHGPKPHSWRLNTGGKPVRAKRREVYFPRNVAIWREADLSYELTMAYNLFIISGL